ncbi:MAG TPA: PP2C family protein-serine/threonine phosphatase [Syntrophomonas sp.]|nr:PP2C family protein-serine/threonine phosphatase [Syntrophomonas sp.]
MSVDPQITALWTLAVTLSGVLSSFLIHATLKRRYSGWLTIAGWTVTLAIGYGCAYLAYRADITNDFVGIIGISFLIWAAGILLYQKSLSGKLFVSIMATLIANVSTFFFCGTTLSFIDTAANPYNFHTITTFMAIKVVWFVIFYLLYYYLVREVIVLVLDTLDGKMEKYLPSPVVSFFGFYIINMITNRLGVFPAVPEMRYIFIGFYAIICLIFAIEFWQIFAAVFWSSRALKTEAELSVASNIQKDMLPSTFPAFPDREEFDVYATMEPAKEVGGDFYDFFMLDDAHLAVVVADVSGKGVPAALFMVVAKTLIKYQTQFGLPPGEVFTLVNEQLCQNNNENMFVTAFMGVLNLSTGSFQYVNAGHNPPLLKRKHSDFEFLKVKSGLVLAGMEGVRYQAAEIQINEGDRLFLYTDGAPEAINTHLREFGNERLLDALNKGQSLPLNELLPFIKKSIDDFAGNADQFDDITMLGLEFRRKSLGVQAVS